MKPIHKKELELRDGEREAEQVTAMGNVQGPGAPFSSQLFELTNSLLLLKGVRIKFLSLSKERVLIYTQCPFFSFPLSHFIFFLIELKAIFIFSEH